MCAALDLMRVVFPVPRLIGENASTADNCSSAAEVVASMTKDKKERNVLDDIFSLKNPSGPTNDPLADIIYRAFQLESEQLPESDEKSLTKTPSKPATRKATHYLREEVLADLVDAKARIAEMFDLESGKGISKSDIINQALLIVLREFEEKGERSLLAEKIKHVLHKKKP